VIQFFTAQPVDIAFDQVNMVSDSPPTYEVGAGSDVRLSWSITNALTATLSGVGQVPLVGSVDIANVLTDQSFTLTANKPGGTRQATSTWWLCAHSPPAPYNVTGSYIPNTATINWEYNRPELIIGFQIYRTRGRAMFGLQTRLF
jgi:hypothetical protein